MTAGLKAWIGAAATAALAVVTIAEGQPGVSSRLAVGLAALVFVPLARDLLAEENESGAVARLAAWTRRFELPAALALALAGLLPAGGWAVLAAGPWAGVAVLGAVTAVQRIRRDRFGRELERLCGDVGFLYLAAGGLWLLVERAGARPWGLEPELMRLGAVHFHFAGLLLPVAAGLVAKEFFFSRFASRAAVGVVLGVPAVAVGILATHAHAGPAIEGAAGGWLGLAGMAVAVFHVRIAIDAKIDRWTRAWFFVAGGALFFGMLLATLYAARPFMRPVPWLDQAWMHALHGTALALGFGLGALLAWRRKASAGVRS